MYCFILLSHFILAIKVLELLMTQSRPVHVTDDKWFQFSVSLLTRSYPFACDEHDRLARSYPSACDEQDRFARSYPSACDEQDRLTRSYPSACDEQDRFARSYPAACGERRGWTRSYISSACNEHDKLTRLCILLHVVNMSGHVGILLHAKTQIFSSKSL